MKKNQKIHTCNILDAAPASRHFWQYSVDGDVKLKADLNLPLGDPLPAKEVVKDWRNLAQPKLNVAWLPADQVFLKVIQLPAANAEELASMLEFQLEKLSPLPVTQIIWAAELLPTKAENMQTVIVVIVERDVIEEFVGALGEQKYQPDFLEIPQLNQVLIGGVREDGCYLYPGNGVEQNLCLVAWWAEGTLRELQLIRLPPPEIRGTFLRDLLMQTIWAGEMEGWLKGPILWNIVADPETASTWAAMLQDLSEIPPEVIAPISKGDIARFTAKRIASGDLKANLLPPEMATTFKQQYHDRLWMGGLGAVVGLYMIGVVVYMIALQVFSYRQTRVAEQVTALSTTYTNVLELRERVQVMQDQVNLKYAALDCLRAASELLPPGFTLTSLTFGRGSVLQLTGTAPEADTPKLNDFNEALRSYSVGGELLFGKVSPPSYSPRPGGQIITWAFNCELQRGEMAE